MIKLDKIFGSMEIDLDTGEIIDNSLIDCYKGGKGAPKPAPAPTAAQTKAQKTAWRNEWETEQEQKDKAEAARKAEEASRKAAEEAARAKKAEEVRIAKENAIKAEGTAKMNELQSNKGLSTMIRTGDMAATKQADTGLMAAAARQAKYGSEAESKAPQNKQKEVTSKQTMRGGDVTGDLGAGLGAVSEEEDGLFFKKKKVK